MIHGRDGPQTTPAAPISTLVGSRRAKAHSFEPRNARVDLICRCVMRFRQLGLPPSPLLAFSSARVLVALRAVRSPRVWTIELCTRGL